MAVVNRNADKLRVLENMPEAGSSEALDQFLATFVANNNKVSTGRIPSPRPQQMSVLALSAELHLASFVHCHNHAQLTGTTLVSGLGAMELLVIVTIIKVVCRRHTYPA
jgi:hypothetical protein